MNATWWIELQRLSLTKQGLVRYELKTPYRDGTTHVIFEPVDFIAKLAALVPKPRVNLTRYHGVFALAMTWAQRLKRVFNIDVETCRACGGSAKVIACIEDPVIIRKILNHLQEKSSLDSAVQLPNPRAPPQTSLFS